MCINANANQAGIVEKIIPVPKRIKFKKQVYNRLLKKFKTLESQVETSANPVLEFKSINDQWLKTASELSLILNQITHTRDEANGGFEV